MKKRGKVFIAFALAIGIILLIAEINIRADDSSSCTSSNPNNLARFYRTWSGIQHFYTASKGEDAEMIRDYSWIDEGITGYIYTSQVPGTVPLYRIWNSTAGYHLYTNSSEEKDAFVTGGLTNEGITGYIYDSEGANRIPLYRYHYYNFVTGSANFGEAYFYTSSEGERWKVAYAGHIPWTNYHYEGIIGYLENFSLNDYSQTIMKLYQSKDSNVSLWDITQEELLFRVDDSCFGKTSNCLGADKTTCESLGPLLSPDDGCIWQEGWNIYKNSAYKIYYDEIFSNPYSGTNPHECTGTNKIIGLNNKNNSLAEIPSLDNYGIDVCYGDLNCTDVTDPEPCPEDYKTVVRLAQDTGSKVSDWCDTSAPIKICCKSTAVNIYWADMLETKMNKSDVEDTVKLIFHQNNIAGKNVKFTIKKQESLFGIDYLWPDAVVAQSDSTGKMTWKAGKKGIENYEAGLFYFQAEINGARYSTLNNEADYQYLEVTAPKNNELIHAEIMSPEDRQIYFKDEKINFVADIYDVDSKITYTWDFGDGNTTTVDGDDIRFKNFNYAYNESGQKNIILRVEDTEGNVRIEKISILIIDLSNSIFAYISQPAYRESINSASINLSGEGSYLINVVQDPAAYGGYVLTCSAGYCPSQTRGCPGEDPVYNGCEINITGTPAGYSNMDFSWRFSDDRWRTFLSPYPEDGSFLNGNSGINITRNFGTGQHEVELRVEEKDNISVFGNYFSLFFTETDGLCSNDNTMWMDRYGNRWNTLETTACGDYLGADSCCPSGYSCKEYDSTNYPGKKKCMEAPELDFCNNVDYCFEYSDSEDITDQEAKCNQDPCNAWQNEWKVKDETNPNYPLCGKEAKDLNGVTYTTKCEKKCYWDDDETNANKKCKFKRNFVKTYPNPSNPDEGYSCIKKITDYLETDDYYTLDWTEDKVQLPDGSIVPVNPALHSLCQSGTIKVKKTANLPFFTLINFLTSIIAISLIYLIRNKINKR